MDMVEIGKGLNIWLNYFRLTNGFCTWDWLAVQLGTPPAWALAVFGPISESWVVFQTEKAMRIESAEAGTSSPGPSAFFSISSNLASRLTTVGCHELNTRNIKSNSFSDQLWCLFVFIYCLCCFFFAVGLELVLGKSVTWQCKAECLQWEWLIPHNI